MGVFVWGQSPETLSRQPVDVVFEGSHYYTTTETRTSTDANGNVTTTTETVTHRSSLVSLRTQVLPELTQVNPGVHAFAFSFVLPDELLPTVRNHDPWIEYSIYTSVTKKGALTSTRAERPVLIAGFERGIAAATALLHTPTQWNHVHHFLADAGPVNITVSAPSRAVVRGTFLPVSVALQNDSEQTLDGLSLGWLGKESKLTRHSGMRVLPHSSLVFTMNVLCGADAWPDAHHGSGNINSSLVMHVHVESGFRFNVYARVPIIVLTTVPGTNFVVPEAAEVAVEPPAVFDSDKLASVPPPVQYDAGAAAPRAAYVAPPGSASAAIAPLVRWVADDAHATCQGCGVEWGVFRRRHHCRACGSLVCGDCCPKQSVPRALSTQRERICATCSGSNPALKHHPTGKDVEK